MPQIVKVVDVTKSFVVVDPNAFAVNLEYTQREDIPEQPLPILAYEGYNFLPTNQGYRSFFGMNSKLNIATLPSRCDKLLIYQFANYKNVLVALCEDGIHVSLTSVGGSLWQSPANAILPIPAVGVHYEWTHCVIENVLYMYRQGSPSVFTISPLGIDLLGVVTIGVLTPTFLNMAGQMGIFRANGRLGFWDSANSISWGSTLVKSDFTPAVETRVGNATFNCVLGRIVTILSQGSGFVIYATKSITGVIFTNNIDMIWEASPITDNAGISYPFEACTGLTDIEHYAYSSTGIKKIGTYNALAKSHKLDEVATEIYDILRESRQPVALQMLEGRYLFFSVIDPTYIDGKASYTYNSIGITSARVLLNNAAVNPNQISNIPTQIGTTNISTHIATQVGLGATLGRYTQWNATGVHMVPPRVSPIHPYSYNPLTNIHVVNPAASLDITSTLSAAQVQTLVSSGTYADVTTNAYPYQLGLGWTYPGLNNVGEAFLGNTDTYLDDFVAIQNAEWSGFTTIQTNTKAAIDAATPIVSAVVQGTTPYFSAVIGIDAEIALYMTANPGSVRVGNTVIVTTKIGEMLSGAGVTTGPTITGTGTTNATMTLTRVFTGGWDVNRVTTRTFTSTRTGAPITNYAIPNILLAPGGTNYTKYSMISAADVTNITQAFVTAAVGVPWQGLGGWFFTSGGQYATNPVVVTGSSAPFFVDYQDSNNLSTTVNAIVTATKTATAWQENLLWGYFTTPALAVAGGYPSTIGQIFFSGANTLPPYATITTPGATFLIQDGSIAPIYPTYTGSFVYDTALKKWGKMKNSFKQILDISPINAISAPVTHMDFGIDMALLDAVGDIYVMDTLPVDSWIRYGKLGYVRNGVTQIEEVRAHFRSLFTGNIITDTSMDTQGLEVSLHTSTPYVGVTQTLVYGEQIGKWHTITISGNYDLHYLEFRGNLAGRY